MHYDPMKQLQRDITLLAGCATAHLEYDGETSLDARRACIAAVVALLAGCAMTVVGTAPVLADNFPVVPDNLKVPASQTLSLATQAIGAQIYECSAAKTDPARFEWVFKAPEAELFDTAGKKIGKHYAGPTWESHDGSKATGEVKAKNDGPDPNAIPWLLLSAKSTSEKGVFSQTQSVQRLYTAGGKAPAEVCSQAQVGKEARVAYRAAYYFYVAKP